MLGARDARDGELAVRIARQEVPYILIWIVSNSGRDSWDVWFDVHIGEGRLRRWRDSGVTPVQRTETPRAKGVTSPAARRAPVRSRKG